MLVISLTTRTRISTFNLKKGGQTKNHIQFYVLSIVIIVIFLVLLILIVIIIIIIIFLLNMLNVAYRGVQYLVHSSF